MTNEHSIELDARLAWALGIGLPEPQAGWGRPEYQEMELAIQRLKKQADAGETILAGREQIASAVAELAELNNPALEETVGVLVALVLDIQRSGVIGGRDVYLIGGLDDFGWPLHDPNEEIVEHLIAAADLGLFDLPGQRRTRPRTRPRPLDNLDNDPNRPTLVGLKTKFTYLMPEVQYINAEGNPVPPPAPKPKLPPTLRELFLSEWERTLGAIVDKIMIELANEDYIDFSTG